MPADNTIVLSDIHLSDAEPPRPGNPLWKRFKRRRHFIDGAFQRMLQHLQGRINGPIELVFNGDIFDFDSVMVLPKHCETSWLERKRGLSSEESKSRFKMKVIMDDHPIFLAALRDFLLGGNRAVFVFGNHDMELHWASVRQDLVDRLRLPRELADSVRFCEWFYISNGDTLIEHGNQYDAYCLCSNPLYPVIRRGSKELVRLPFGNLAGKFMLNGMGLMNPHVDGSFIKSTIREYSVFYYRYLLRTQPFLLFTWFWGAMATLLYSVGEGFLPAVRDPLTVERRVADIAARANATPAMVWSLRELHAHPAIYNPFKILRELWLDRAIFFLAILVVSFQFFSTLNVFVSVSLWWFALPLGILLPVFVSYAQSVESELEQTQRAAWRMAPLSARIAQVERVVHGHLHRERHAWFDGVEYLNTGTWSPAFRDVECTQPFGKKCFAWIRHVEGQDGRVAELYEWKDEEIALIPAEPGGYIPAKQVEVAPAEAS